MSSARTPEITAWNIVSPLAVEDCALAVSDLLRVSVSCDDIDTAMRVVDRLRKGFAGARYCGLKNTFLFEHDAVPAQYRDCKVYLEMDFDNNWSNFLPAPETKPDEPLTLVVEVQVMLTTWTEIKQRNAIQYKIRRATTAHALSSDTSKYLDGLRLSTRGLSQPSHVVNPQFPGVAVL